MTATRVVDLNSDLGEGFGAFRAGDDEALFPLISSANVACGFHGGDPRVMERTVARAKAAGVGVGAHPSFLDLVGFGRRTMAATPDEIRTDCLYQIGALAAFCRAADVPLRHVKAHGALYNLAVKDEAAAGAIADAVRSFDPDLLFLAQPGSALARAGEAAELAVVHEAFADRAYNADGSLVARSQPGAVLTDPRAVAARMVRLVTEGVLTTIDGQELRLTPGSICVHSDTPTAVAIATALRAAFDEAGIAVRPMGSG